MQSLSCDVCRINDRRISEQAQNARKGGSSKDMSMEAEQTAWLASNGVATTNSDAKYTWHCAPEAKVRIEVVCCCNVVTMFDPHLCANVQFAGLVWHVYCGLF
jgi:hypothetical protein